MKVTIEFDSADEAIVALGAVRKAGAIVAQPEAEAKVKTDRKPRSDAGQPRGPYRAAPQNANAMGAPTTADAAVDTSGNAKGITDPSSTAKGPAGASASTTPVVSGATPVAAAPKATATSAGPEAGTPGGNGIATPGTDPSNAGVKPAASTSTTTPGAQATITDDAVQGALEKLFNKLDYEGARVVLQRFGVARGKDLAQAQRAEFLRRVEDICAGKYAGTDAWPA